MTDDDIEAIAIERLCKSQFALDITVDRFVARDLYTGRGSFMSVFEDSLNNMYALCRAENNLSLADVKSAMRGAGIEADAYVPPHGDNDYFSRHARKSFLSVYPGRRHVNDEETTFYHMFAPYNPALIRVANIKNGLYEYKPIMRQWQKEADVSYTYAKVR